MKTKEKEPNVLKLIRRAKKYLEPNEWACAISLINSYEKKNITINNYNGSPKYAFDWEETGHENFWAKIYSKLIFFGVLPMIDLGDLSVIEEVFHVKIDKEDVIKRIYPQVRILDLEVDTENAAREAFYLMESIIIVDLN